MKKPFEFITGSTYGDFGLTDSQKNNLKIHLGEKFPKNKKKAFLDLVSVGIDRANKSRVILGNEKPTIDRIEKFSYAAHALGNAIDGLKSTSEGLDQDPFQYLATYHEESLFLTEPYIKLPTAWLKFKPKLEDILNELQLITNQMELLADYTITKIHVSNGSRPDVQQAKCIALAVTEEYQKFFKKLPPFSRGSWYANFMTELGRTLQLEIGDRVLSYAKASLSKN